MGTCNFAINNNAENVYVVLCNTEVNVKKCTECDEIHHEYDYTLSELKECISCKSTDLEEDTITEQPSSEDHEFLVEYIRELLSPLGFCDADSCDNDRSRPSTTFSSKYVSKFYGDVEVAFTIECIITSAYYEGASLDYLVSVEDDYVEGDDIEGGFEWFFEDSYEMNGGMKKIQLKNSVKWAEKEIAKIFAEIEDVYKKVTQYKLSVIGVGSNGVAHYQEVK